MENFEISNATSGAVLGVYHAENEAAALDMMARDAGYSDYTDAQSVAPAEFSEVIVNEIGAQSAPAQEQAAV